jgi:peptidoglycan/xylan/chitin deacetylase (PgdA/CDA1 family)
MSINGDEEKMLNITNPKWPDNKKFAVCLTHDVDRVKKTYQYFTRFVRFLKNLEIKKAFNELLCFIKFYFSKNPKKDPYWNFDIIMEIERKLGVKSTFFFLNEQRKFFCSPSEWKLYWGRYSIENPEIAKIIKKLNSKGWEIGLHGSYKSYKDKNLLKKEKEELEKILGKRIRGVRQHYGNLKIPETWKSQERLGFEYDSTFGVTDTDCVDFKDNRYLPFYPLDSLFLEIPLIIMDHRLFSSDKSVEELWKDCKKIIDIIEENNGVLTILWHNRIFDEKEFPGRSEIYEKLIKICKEKDAWITNAYSIAEWLTMRGK